MEEAVVGVVYKVAVPVEEAMVAKLINQDITVKITPGAEVVVAGQVVMVEKAATVAVE